jgi:Mg/Co/Ni transporter MgtE
MESDIKILENFIRNHTEEAVSLIEMMEIDQIIDLLGKFPNDLIALTLSAMDRFIATRIIFESDLEIAITLLGKCTPELTAHLIRPLNRSKSEKILSGMDSKHTSSIKLMLSFPDNTVGSIMTSDVLTLSQNITIGNALEKVRNNPTLVHSQIYILSNDNQLKGMTDLQSMISAPEINLLKSIMKTEFKSVLGSLQIETLIKDYFNDTTISILPVVDINNVFLGIVERGIVLRKTQVKNKDKKQLHQTSAALGDLFQIGLSSLIRGSADVLWNSKDK